MRGKSLTLTVIVAFSLLFQTNAFSEELFRPLHFSELSIATTYDWALHVPEAEVAHANYGLIRKDFHQCAAMNDVQIRHWVIEQFAYVSEAQLNISGIRTTEMRVDRTRRKRVARPPSYERAGVIEAEDGGLVDIKGLGLREGNTDSNGAAAQVEAFKKLESNLKEAKQAVQEFHATAGLQPNEAQNEIENSLKDLEKNAEKKLRKYLDLDHSDGSITLGESLEETSIQRASQIISNLHNHEHPRAPRMETVETYFTIKLPWAVKRSGGEDVAALYGRQPHQGRGRGTEVSPQVLYNLVNSHPGAKVAGNALQITNSGAVVDFGALILTDPVAFEFYHYKDSQGQPLSLAMLHDTILPDLKHIDSQLSEGRQWSYEKATEAAALFFHGRNENARNLIDSHMERMTQELVRRITLSHSPALGREDLVNKSIEELRAIPGYRNAEALAQALPVSSKIKRLQGIYFKVQADKGALPQEDLDFLLDEISHQAKALDNPHQRYDGSLAWTQTEQLTKRNDHLRLNIVLSAINESSAKSLVQRAMAKGVSLVGELGHFVTATNSVLKYSGQGIGPNAGPASGQIELQMAMSQEPSLRASAFASLLTKIEVAEYISNGSGLADQARFRDEVVGLLANPQWKSVLLKALSDPLWGTAVADKFTGSSSVPGIAASSTDPTIFKAPNAWMRLTVVQDPVVQATLLQNLDSRVELIRDRSARILIDPVSQSILSPAVLESLLQFCETNRQSAATRAVSKFLLDQLHQGQRDSSAYSARIEATVRGGVVSCVLRRLNL